MATLPDTAAALKALRASLVPEYQAAKAASDATKMKQFTDLAGEIDDTLDTLALIGLAQAAQRLAAYAARFEALTQLAHHAGLTEQSNATLPVIEYTRVVNCCVGSSMSFV